MVAVVWPPKLAVPALTSEAERSEHADHHRPTKNTKTPKGNANKNKGN